MSQAMRTFALFWADGRNVDWSGETAETVLSRVHPDDRDEVLDFTCCAETGHFIPVRSKGGDRVFVAKVG